MGEIERMDSDLASAIEAYNGANVELDRIDGELDTNARHLGVATKSLANSQERIAKRLRALYIDGASGGVVEILLGAQSLDELLTRLDVVERVGAQDAQVLTEVKKFKKDVETSKRRLEAARTSQAKVVAERESRKQWIENKLAERQSYLASVKNEIAELQEAERRRAAQAAAQARARLAAQQAAAQTAAAPSSSTGGGVAITSDADFTPSYAPVPPPDGSRASQVVAIAMQYLGVPYVWGGMSPSGFDCSGLTAYAYAQIGISLPHHAAAQWNYGVPVSRDQLAPGDLVFFSGLGHMGMYIGGGQFIHAPHTGDVVKISSLDDRAGNYVGARRVL